MAIVMYFTVCVNIAAFKHIHTIFGCAVLLPSFAVNSGEWRTYSQALGLQLQSGRLDTHVSDSV